MSDDQMFWALVVGAFLIPWIAVGIHPVSEVAVVVLFIEVSAVVGLTIKHHYKASGPEDISTIIFAGFAILIVAGTTLALMDALSMLSLAATFEVLLGTTAVLRRLNLYPKMVFVIPGRALIAVAIVTGIGLAFATLVKLNAPYPLQIDTDIIKEVIRINAIAVDGHAPLFFSSVIRPVADDTLLATVALMTGSTGYAVEWAAPFATFVLYGLGTMFLAKRFFARMPHGVIASDDGWPEAVVAAIFVTAICGFWTFLGPAILIPEEISIIVTLFLLSFYMDWQRMGWGQLVDVLLILVVISIGYYYIVPFVLPFIALIQIAPMSKKLYVSVRGSVLLLVVSLAIMIVSLVGYGGAYGEATATFSASFIFSYMFAGYSPTILLFAFLGLAAIWGRKVMGMSPVLLFALLTLMLLLVPLSFSNRLEPFGRAEIAIMAALGVSRFVAYGFASSKSRTRLVAIAVLLLASTPVLIAPYMSWVNQDVNVQDWSGLPLPVMSQDEGQAGLWLQKSASRGGFVVSDMVTSAIMQALSGAPGMYDPLQFLSNDTTVVQVYRTLMANNMTAMKGLLETIRYGPGIRPTHFYIVFSSRTEESLSVFKSIQTSGGVTISEAVGSADISTTLLVYYPPSTTAFPSWISNPVYRNPTVEIFNVTV